MKNSLLYNFVGTHSFLGGLFLFFLPVFLYTNGFNITHISTFIAITGVSFLVAMYIWDHIRYEYGYRPIIIISFVLQIILVSLWYLEKNIFFLIILAIFYGFYNCFFWITKRYIFSMYTEKKSVGNAFGNIQILWFILVKVGILFSSFFLEYDVYWYIFALMTAISLFSLWHFLKYEQDLKIRSKKQQEVPLKLRDIISFKDNYNSKYVFILDGPFLYFESFFWVLTLFFISQESFRDLWLLAIWLALSFSIIFWLIKEYIDHLNAKKLFTLAVILYSIWWGLRSITNDIEYTSILYAIIICITFFSTFFRLVFNKNFFVLSKESPSQKYLLLKSYYSQAMVAITFSLFAFASIYIDMPLEELLLWSYLLVCPLSLLYFVYHTGDISLKN